MGLRVTYQLANGPRHIPIEEYAASVNRQYSEMLEGNPSEADVQCFLEKHPCLVPGHSTPGVSGHYPLHCSLITQPELPGQKSYRPDFMWIATHSSAWFLTLIEIEMPDKRVFNNDGYTSSKFNHARDQLAEWRSWFNDPGNFQQFMRLYGIPDLIRGRMMRLHMILVYGRRAEFEHNPNLTEKRGSLLLGDGAELMSFDRLSANMAMRDAITIKATGFGKYRAVWIPPVFRVGPFLSDRFLHIEGISEAIDQNMEISGERREFLKRRIVYWKERELSSDPGLSRFGDWE